MLERGAFRAVRHLAQHAGANIMSGSAAGFNPGYKPGGSRMWTRRSLPPSAPEPRVLHHARESVTAASASGAVDQVFERCQSQRRHSHKYLHNRARSDEATSACFTQPQTTTLLLLACVTVYIYKFIYSPRADD